MSHKGNSMVYPMDLKARVDELLAAPKTILGDPVWRVGQRPETREMRRILLESGESRGAKLVSVAFPGTVQHEYRHMIVFTPEEGRRADGKCVTRLDFAPTIDGPHVNDFNGPLGYPACEIPDPHYHDWAGNRQLTKVKELPSKLLYARHIGSRINDIDDGFWWFCQQNQIGASTRDVPGWPPPERLL